MLDAVTRYGMGGDGYVDPVAFENVFEIVDGVPALTFEPMIRVRGDTTRAALSLWLVVFTRPEVPDA